MIVFPLLAAVVAVVFAARLLGEYARRRGWFYVIWALALLMYAGASVALALGVLDRWSTAEYRTFYLLGAILNVPYLALGEVYLLTRGRALGHAALALLLVASAFATGAVRTADVDVAALDHELPAGKEVFGDGSRPHVLAQWFGWGGYVLLLAGTLWSALSIRGVPELRDRFVGILLIAVGATIVAAGTGIAAGLLGSFVWFSVGLLGGIVVMFAGFLRAQRRRAPAPA